MRRSVAVPALAIAIETRGGELRLRGQPHGRQPFDRPISALALATARRRLGERLLAVRRHLGNGVERQSWQKIESALALLKKRSRSMLGTLIEDPDDHREFTDLCKRALLLETRPSRGYPSVEITSTLDHFFPFELVVLDEPPNEIHGVDDLLRACECFLGFSAVIRRTLTDCVPSDGLPRDHRLHGGPALPVALIVDDTTHAAHRARNDFASNASVVLDGPWPTSGLPADTISPGLGGRVYDARRRFAGSLATVPDQIQHFACHCDTQLPDPEKWALQVRASGGEPISVTLSALRGAVHEAAHEPESARRPWSRPLVFLNACGTAEMRPFATGSFCRLFLKNGNRAVVATATRVPDRFAAAFASLFYRHLLLGSPAGAALLTAKHDMIRRHFTPLGILYSLYGDAELALDRGDSAVSPRRDTADLGAP